MDQKHNFIFSIVLLAAITILILYNYVGPLFFSKAQPMSASKRNNSKLVLTDAEWRRRLTPMQYEIMRKHITEAAFSGKYATFDEEGTYNCAACATPLFSSKDKYDAKTGWATFTKPLSDQVIWYSDEKLANTKSLKTFCSHCDSFIGTLFFDGPAPKNERYSINSLALSFVPKEK